MNEYMILYMLIFEMNILRPQLDYLMKEGMSPDNIRKTRVAESLINFFSIENFPEAVLSKPIFTVYSEFSFFSSRQVIESIHHKNLYNDLLSKVSIAALESTGKILPKIIGFSVVFSNQVIPAFRMAYCIKKKHPDIHITMGGPFISLYFNEIKNHEIFNIVDSLITGEGEIPLSMLSGELSEKKPDFNKIPGMIYNANGNINHNKEAVVLEMNESPAPDYNIFDLDNYLFGKEDMWLSFRLSKGCNWGKCAFCRTEHYFENCQKKAEKEFIYGQLKEVVLSSGIRNINFSDESFDPVLMEYICSQLIKDNLKINWKAHTRIDKNMSRERCLLFKESGCTQISLGIESFNDRVLKIMKKGITERLVDEVLNNINGIIPVNLYMMIGFPGETKEETERGYQKILEYKEKGLIEHYYYSYFSIVYGSDIYINPSNYGIKSIFVPPEDDLHPDIIFFESEGMSKDDAYHLHEKFMRPYFHDIFKDYPEIVSYINDRLNFDVDSVRKCIFAQNGKLYLPLVKWMKNCDEYKDSKESLTVQ